jgi:hypothetical protein
MTMDDKKKLCNAIRFLIDVLVFFSLLITSGQLRDLSKQTGLAWQGGFAVWAFALVFLYFGVKIFRIPWKEVRSWPGHPRGLFFYLLPPKFWGAMSILIGIGFVVQGASIMLRGTLPNPF